MTAGHSISAIAGGLVALAAFSAMIPARADDGGGRAVYLKWCSACHMDSPFAAGTIRLRYSRGKDRAVVTERSDLPPEYVRVLVRKGMNGMPLFRRTEIDDDELELLIDYLTSRK